MVVLRRYYDDTISFYDRVTPFGKSVLQSLAVVVVRQGEISHIEQARANLRPLVNLADEPLRDKSTVTRFSIRAKQYWNIQLVHVCLEED